MVKGLFIMDQAPFEFVYPMNVRKEIENIADIYTAPMTNLQIQQDLSVLKDAEVIFSGWGGPRLDESFLNKAPKLKAFFYAAGSLKHIVTKAAWEREIVFTNAVRANAVPVAEYTLSQILFCLKRGWAFTRGIRNEKQYPKITSDVPGAFRSTVGIVSLSTVGRMVCNLLKLFDVQVIAYDPYVKMQEAEKLGVQLVGLEDIFKRSDIVSLHTPLLKETIDMIGKEHLSHMRQNSSIINTSRGAIIKESEMIEILHDRPDITAVLDVTFPEPPHRDSPLYKMDNVILTPHLAGSVGKECERLGACMLEEFHRYINKQSLQWQVREESFHKLA